MKNVLWTLAIVCLAATLAGCAVTDYSGYAGHKTTGEAKLLGLEISFNAGEGDPLTGTYSYTVKYDNRGGQGAVTINSYKNDVVSSFSRDGIIDRDGDDIQGRGGTAGGTFLPFWRAVDLSGGGSCEFSDNITFAKGGAVPIISFCTTTNEEVDADFDLQAAFGDLGAFVGHIWSSRGQATSLEVESIDFGGVNAPIQPVSLGMRSNGLRPIELSVAGDTAAFDSLLQAVLDNTEHQVPVDLTFHFAGGMALDLPSGVQVAFNHHGVRSTLDR